MTDFETYPVVTADLVKRLLDCAESDFGLCDKAAAHIEQLEAELPRVADRIEQLEAALTRANAATAAAYEVAAQVADDYTKMRERQIAEEKAKAALHVNVPQVMRWQAGKVQSEAISAQIRALATPDQTAALERLIAEAVGPYVEALAWYGEQARLARLIHSEGDAGRNALQADGGKRANAILVASKKGGA